MGSAKVGKRDIVLIRRTEKDFYDFKKLYIIKFI